MPPTFVLEEFARRFKDYKASEPAETNGLAIDSYL
jgi:hypothetical protein